MYAIIVPAIVETESTSLKDSPHQQVLTVWPVPTITITITEPDRSLRVTHRSTSPPPRSSPRIATLHDRPSVGENNRSWSRNVDLFTSRRVASEEMGG